MSAGAYTSRSYSRTVAPTSLPVTIDEVKQYARVDDEDVSLDGTIVGLMNAAVQRFDGKDGILNRALVTQTWALYLDSFPGRSDRPIVVPLPPLQSVTSITYVDENGDTQTWAAANYTVDGDLEPGRILPAFNATYPTTRYQPKAVTVTFVAGYGANLADTPEPIRLAILALVSHWLENPEPVLTGTSGTPLPNHVDALVAPYRRLGFRSA